MELIYLDNNATTKLDEEVLAAMLPYFTDYYGNPSSFFNIFGQEAEKAVQNAKTCLADCFHTSSVNDFIFTSGATESNNLALMGVIKGSIKTHPHIIVSSIEHASVLNVCKQLENQGVLCTYLPVEPNGIINASSVENAITQDTVLISVMSANNEIGTIQPIDAIAQIAHKRGILFHTDATQYLSYKLIDISKIPIDLFTASAHKIHGPKGIGVLYANANARRLLQPQLFGGGHQNNLRSGTLNVPGIIGLAKAVEILGRDQEKDNQRIATLRNTLLQMIKEHHQIFVNGDMIHRLPNNLNFYFPNISSNYLAEHLSNVAFSKGSACLSENNGVSHVLESLGLCSQEIESSVRFGLSKYNTLEEIIYISSRIRRMLDG